MTKERFNSGWRFHLGELALPPRRVVAKATLCGGLADLTVDEIMTKKAKSIEEGTDLAELAQVAEFAPEDGQFFTPPRPANLAPREWSHVHLPHDWVSFIAPQPEWEHRPDYAFTMTGSQKISVAYYRKTWIQPAPSNDERIFLEFDGVMRHSEVWFNGNWLGYHASGYTGFQFDLTNMMRDPEDAQGLGKNVLLVRCDNAEAEGWWREGGGIYRDVWLEKTSQVHIVAQGVNVTVDKLGVDMAELTITCDVGNKSGETQAITVKATIYSPGGEVVQEVAEEIKVPNQRVTEASVHTMVTNPILWDIGQGNLYQVKIVLLSSNGRSYHETVRNFGIRTLGYNDEGKFLLNNRVVQIRGANIHQDFAGLGNALPRSVITYKLGLMREMGCNTIRNAHHPSSELLLEAADRFGMLLISENRLLATSPSYRDDLVYLLRRDRIHPSVFLWSLGNEEFHLEGTVNGARILRELVQIVRSYDTSRASIIAGATHAEDKNYFDAADVLGLHYGIMMGHLPAMRRRWGNKPILLDEEGLFSTARGQYVDDATSCYGSSFGSKLGMMAGLTDIFNYIGKMGGREEDHKDHDVASLWHLFVQEKVDVMGAIVWAGMDYAGEPNPVRWPAVASSYGARDSAGIPKDYYWAIKAAFVSKPLVHAFPHWTHPGKEGEKIRTWVISNTERVEVFVNGKIIAKSVVVENTAKFDGENALLYVPGIMEVKGYNGGKLVAVFTSKTAGPAARLKFYLPRTTISADGDDAIVARVQIVDTDGVFCPEAENRIKFAVSGPGKIIGVGNGDPSTSESEKMPQRTAFRGWAVVLVQSTKTEEGNILGSIVIQATAGGLMPAEARIEAVTTGAEDPVNVPDEAETGGIHSILG